MCRREVGARDCNRGTAGNIHSVKKRQTAKKQKM